MKGLLLKDWYMMKKDCRYNLIMALIFAVCGMFAKSLFWVVWPQVVVALLPTTLIGLEEQAGWHLYADAMPYSRKTLVSEKYLLVLLLTLAVSLILVLGYGLSGAIQALGITILDLLSICVVVGLLAPSFMLPMTFKWGMVKGRIAYIICLALIGGLGGVMGSMAEEGVLNISSINLFNLVVFAGSLVLFAISWMLSIRFYEKREL